jgi:hypothetical protein
MIITLPSFRSYGNYSSSNYGAHCLQFTDADSNLFWFSYQTLVAFKKGSSPTVVHRNDWGTTTGKHLNLIDGGDKAAKKTRLDSEKFAAAFTAAFGKR